MATETAPPVLATESGNHVNGDATAATTTAATTAATPEVPAKETASGTTPAAAVNGTEAKDQAAPTSTTETTPPAVAAAAATPKSDANANPDPEPDFAGTVDVNNDLPTSSELEKVGDVLLLDENGGSRPFRELYKGGDGTAPRQLIIFVRHFFCGNCQEYLRTLSASITPDSLLALPTPTFITVIGCGKPELIRMYTDATSCPFPIYAEPTRKLYDALGMTRTWDLGPKPAYIQSNLFVTSVQSIVQSLRTGSKALKGGDFKQVGGEFLFEGGACTFVHRMRHTRDHMEVGEVRKLVGLEGERPLLRKRWSRSVKALADGVGRRSASLGKAKGKSGAEAPDATNTTPAPAPAAPAPAPATAQA